MVIGIPKEIKANENRVAVVPAGVATFKKYGHQVLVERSAGLGSGISDGEYEAEGAEIVSEAKEIYKQAEMIIKVKEPLPPEYPLLREEQIVFGFLHLAPIPELTKALLEAKVVGIAYETIELEDGSLPLLKPMSEVAGRMAVPIAAYYLSKNEGGMGLLMGGIPGVPPAHVVIIGGGIVGVNAARIAAGMGARVTLLELSAERMRYLDEILPENVTTLMSNSYNIREAVKEADVLIGAVLIHGAKAPCLVTRDMVRTMKKGSVIIDVAVDQGGCVETIRPTTHGEPTYIIEGVVHYGVANMPGAYPRTSTFALTNVTLPYGLEIANKGYKRAILESRAIAKGVNVIAGRVTCKAVAEAQGLPYTSLEEILS